MFDWIRFAVFLAQGFMCNKLFFLHFSLVQLGGATHKISQPIALHRPGAFAILHTEDLFVDKEMELGFPFTYCTKLSVSFLALPIYIEYI